MSVRISGLKTSKRSSSRSTLELQGSKISLPSECGGLGKRYYDQLGQDLDKILQVDVVSGITETKGSVRARSIKLAMEMQHRGIKENDIIVLSSRTHTNQTIVVLATLFIGAILAPLDPEISHKETLELIRQLRPKMFFGDSRSIPQFERAFLETNINIDIVNFNTDNAGTVQFNKMLNQKEDESFKPAFVENPKTSVAFVLPTQGTTGTPKLICLSHQNIYFQTLIFLEAFDHPDKVISFFPLSWFLQTTLTCVSFEATTTRILPGVFTERSACKIIHDFNIGHAIFGTDFAIKIASSVAIRDFDLNCLKCVMIGTVNTTKYDIQMLKTLMPWVRFLQCYALTETGVIAVTSMRNYTYSLIKKTSVGRLTVNCKVRIVDLDTAKTVPQNTYGELYYYGDGMMLGYFKDPDKTLASMEKGFFKTGDVAKYDDDGWIYIKNRVQDIIRIDNQRYYPSDLEDIILMHPSVKDVVVIAKGTEVVACVKKRKHKDITEEKMLKFISERYMENNKPTKIIFMDHFPRTSIGSVKKRVLLDDILSVKIKYTSSLASISGISNNVIIETRKNTLEPESSEPGRQNDESSLERSWSELHIHIMEEIIAKMLEKN